jgi:hypothetical protein
VTLELEQRKFPRKVLKTKALAAMDGQAPIAGRTVDLGADGVSMNFNDPVEAGKNGYVRFDLFIDGKPVTVTARANARYCIFSQGEFKVGFQFVDLDRDASIAINRFLR